ncbi:hypothetical protein HJG60_009110 [Phyllostomus discolor]|uniref:Uncharacterized protein n=1 Tax=Phyllostomus discolor TaxID=89673 RepID=A0A833YQE9_9CHIR|nr:hypothetical protein HJG60_009110 [Phyllostomus discolor]
MRTHLPGWVCGSRQAQPPLAGSSGTLNLGTSAALVAATAQRWPWSTFCSQGHTCSCATHNSRHQHLDLCCSQWPLGRTRRQALAGGGLAGARCAWCPCLCPRKLRRGRRAPRGARDQGGRKDAATPSAVGARTDLSPPPRGRRAGAVGPAF